MDITIYPGKLRGTVRAPASKSEMHRLLICAALSPGRTEILCPDPAEDIAATAGCLRSLGAKITRTEDGYIAETVRPAGPATADCGESGSTLRFLLPVAAALGIETHFLCGGRLSGRPVGPVLEVLRAGGCTAERVRNGYALSGKLNPGDYALDAGSSSQFLSGMLLAMPLLPGSSVRLTGELVSADYVEITGDVMRRFGAPVRCGNGTYSVSGEYMSPGACAPEGDWSSAAFWFAANAAGSSVQVTGLNEASVQGDRSVQKWIRTVLQGGASIDAQNIPDLVPPLAVLAAVTPGRTRFVRASRLRTKESDRIDAICAMLNALGGECGETEDGFFVEGVPVLKGGRVNGCGDHRIAMAAAVAATACSGPVTVEGAECVNKSYPGFWKDYQKLGGMAE